MSDYIKREDAIEVLMETIAPPSITLDTLTMRMDNIPTADVVEVVRCKDCKFYRVLVEAAGVGLCEKWAALQGAVQKGYYCSYGERKNDERE